MKEQPADLLSNEQKKETFICAKNVIHTVHKFGTKVNKRNIKQKEYEQYYNLNE